MQKNNPATLGQRKINLLLNYLSDNQYSPMENGEFSITLKLDYGFMVVTAKGEILQFCLGVGELPPAGRWQFLETLLKKNGGPQICKWAIEGGVYSLNHSTSLNNFESFHVWEILNSFKKIIEQHKEEK